MARKGKLLKSNKRDSSFIREIRVLGQLCTQVIHRSQLFHGTCCLMKLLVATKRFFEKLGLTRVTLTLFLSRRKWLLCIAIGALISPKKLSNGLGLYFNDITRR